MNVKATVLAMPRQSCLQRAVEVDRADVEIAAA